MYLIVWDVTSRCHADKIECKQMKRQEMQEFDARGAENWALTESILMWLILADFNDSNIFFKFKNFLLILKI